jgi:hypothetical protein
VDKPFEYVFKRQSHSPPDDDYRLPLEIVFQANDDETAIDLCQAFLDKFYAPFVPNHWDDYYYLEDDIILDSKNFCLHGQERTLNGCEDCHAEEAKHAK